MPANRIPGLRVARVAVPAATIVLVAAACGSGSAAKPAPAAATGQASGAGVTLATRSGAAGTYLTDGSGRSLYEFASDTATKSTCTGPCASAWPPLTSSSPATAGSGVSASGIATLTRSDGSKQVTYRGHPLYYFAGDSAPGQTNGQGSNAFGAKWWLLSPAGSAITASSSSGSSSGSGGGYGY